MNIKASMIRLARSTGRGRRFGILAAAGCVALAVASAVAADAEAHIPFAMPPGNGGAADRSFLNAPLDETSRLVCRDGHFVDARGRRVRLWGVNLAAGACFPTNDADAVTMAEGLRACGFNAVRLHHMDSSWASPNLFQYAGGYTGAPQERLDERSLARLDRLVAELKARGIYVDVNLHVGRVLTAQDGFADIAKIEQHGKAIGFIDPANIERQQQFARLLLTHRNPFTGTTFAEDPAVAFVELTNEDSLLKFAPWIPDWPARYRNVVSQLWNGWLKTRYGTDERLRAAWLGGDAPLGTNMLTNARLEQGTTGWSLSLHEESRATLSGESCAGATDAPAGNALTVRITNPGAAGYHVEVSQTLHGLRTGTRHTLTFAARADARRTLRIRVMGGAPGWTTAGLDESMELSPNWQRYAFSFTMTAVAGPVRLNLAMGQQAPTVQVADLALCEGGQGAILADGQTLAAGTIPLQRLNGGVAGEDWVRFLMAVESSYTTTMRDTIRGFGCRAPVLCSQASYGGAGGLLRESRMDLVDMHAYWQHPSFPHKAWNYTDYRIGNQPMAAAADGTGAGMAMHRVAGLPFTVTEYDHPAPSEYAAEDILSIATLAALQDWDGIFLFDWSGSADSDALVRDRIENFFDVMHHPAKRAFLPAAADLFRRGALPPAPVSWTLSLPEDLIPKLVAQRSEYAFWKAATGAPDARGMVHSRAAVRLVPGSGTPTVARSGSGEPLAAWRDPAGGHGALVIDTPAVQAAVGLIAGETVTLSRVTLAVAPSLRRFAAVSVSTRDGRPVDASTNLLLAAVDKAENAGLVWNAEHTYGGTASWSRGPVEIVAVQADVTITTSAAGAEVWALAPDGARRAAVPCRLADGALHFAIGPQWRTLWYEVVAKP